MSRQKLLTALIAVALIAFVAVGVRTLTSSDKELRTSVDTLDTSEMLGLRGVVHAEPSESVEQSEKVEVDKESTEAEKPAVEPEKKPERVITWRDNPNKCDTDKQWIAKEKPFKCIDKPVRAEVKPVQRSPAGGSGSCAQEIKKYGWNQTVAYNVMMAESGGNAGVVNNNPATRDYSVGCFQVNLYGANAANRPSEAWLKVASNNVSWAYSNYVANGHSFIGQWGVCRHISCY